MMQKMRTTTVLRAGALMTALSICAFSAASAGTATDSGTPAAASTENSTFTAQLDHGGHCWRHGGCGGSSSSSSSSSGGSSSGSSSSSSSGGSSSSSSSGGGTSSSSSGGSTSSSSSGGSSSSSSGGTTTAALAISTQGNHFVDAHGNTLQVRGVNVSGLESGII